MITIAMLILSSIAAIIAIVQKLLGADFYLSAYLSIIVALWGIMINSFESAHAASTISLIMKRVVSSIE